MSTRQTETLLWPCATPPPNSEHPDGQVMTIGQLAQRTNVTVKALRRYEGMGLIYTLGRSSTGYRLFDESALGCVDTIQSLRALGLTEAEIAQLAKLPQDQPVGPQLDRMLRTARARITARIDALRQMRQRIDDFSTRLAADGRREELDSTPGGRS